MSLRKRALAEGVASASAGASRSSGRGPALSWELTTPSAAGATGESPPLVGGAVIIDLPFPLSTNALYANAGDRGRVKSARYRTWVTAAGWEIKRQRPRSILGPYSIRITVERKGGRRRDLGNLHKCCSDILVAHGVIADDSDEQEIHMAWSRAVTGCRVEITPIKGG